MAEKQKFTKSTNAVLQYSSLLCSFMDLYTNNIILNEAKKIIGTQELG